MTEDDDEAWVPLGQVMRQLIQACCKCKCELPIEGAYEYTTIDGAFMLCDRCSMRWESLTEKYLAKLMRLWLEKREKDHV